MAGSVHRGYLSILVPAWDLRGFEQRKFTEDLPPWWEVIKHGWNHRCPALWNIWSGDPPGIIDGSKRLQAALENNPDMPVPVVLVCHKNRFKEILTKAQIGHWEWGGSMNLDQRRVSSSEHGSSMFDDMAEHFQTKGSGKHKNKVCASGLLRGLFFREFDVVRRKDGKGFYGDYQEDV